MNTTLSLKCAEAQRQCLLPNDCSDTRKIYNEVKGLLKSWGPWGARLAPQVELPLLISGHDLRFHVALSLLSPSPSAHAHSLSRSKINKSLKKKKLGALEHLLAQLDQHEVSGCLSSSPMLSRAYFFIYF